MPAPLRHFALNASDVDIARRFYGAVLDWRFTPWGPPGFFQIDTGDGSVQGALQKRRELVAGSPMIGLEGTFGVEDVAAVARAAMASGGRLLAETTTISGVGHLAWLGDPDGNAFGVMQYDPAAE